MDIRERFRRDVLSSLSGKVPKKLAEEALEKPPANIGSDLALPCFLLARKEKRNPAEIAKELSSKLKPKGLISEINFYGPYVNFYLDWKKAGLLLVRQVLREKEGFGMSNARKKERVMVEYSAPNTNKPLHLGHLRNQAIGMSVSRILEATGHKVIRANLYNDRGAHICKSMLAYRKWGKGKKPNTKPDHFVGKFYVMFEKKKNEKLEKEAREMLNAWEKGDREVRALWKRMSSWSEKGFEQTYKRFGSEFDVVFRESEFWDKAGPVIEKGKKRGIIKKEKDGALLVDLEKHGLGKKVIIRSDGTHIYVTNDLALTPHKFRKHRLDRSLWVVGSEQGMYLRQLFKIFELLGYRWADRCRHLSFGLVFLPEGKMKSREGKVVDADDIIEEVRKLAEKEIMEREKGLGKKELEKRSLQIGLAALKYFLLRIDLPKDIHFSPEESISFDGDTGPYLQYSHARAMSIMEKAGRRKVPREYSYESPREIRLLKQMSELPDAVRGAARDMKPHYIANYCLELATRFSEFYQEVPVIKASGEVRNARLALVDAFAQTMRNALALLDIEAPERM